MASEIIHFLLSTARDEKSVLRVHPDRRSRPVTVIREGRRRVLVALRQSEPSLDPEQAVRPAAGCRRIVLRMGDSAARDHPVQCARTDDSIGPGRVRRWTSPRQRPVTVARPICGFGQTSIPWPVRRAAGPAWWKTRHARTVRRSGAGTARRISKPPRSLARRLMSVSIASTPTPLWQRDSRACSRSWRHTLGLVRPPTIVAKGL